MFYSCFTFSKYIFIKFFRYINMKQNLNSKNKVRKLNHKVMGEKISCVTEERRVMKNVKWKNRERQLESEKRRERKWIKKVKWQNKENKW